MSRVPHRHEWRNGIAFSLQWGGLTGLLGVLVGSACALFLGSLDFVTRLRFDYPWLLWFLPIAGALTGAMYLRWGRTVASGNNLLIEQIKQPGEGVPPRIAPLVLVGTLLSHLGGGSAGREGTAVQMGGGIAGGIARWLPGLSSQEQRVLWMAGIAAGFGGVFGTPLAGLVFALELPCLGRVEWRAVLPCLVASLVSHWTCTAWGIDHTFYQIQHLVPEGATVPLTVISGRLILAAVVCGIAFGVTGRLFVEMTHGIQRLLDRTLKNPITRPIAGGCVVIALVFLLGTREYLGLGVTNPDSAAASIVNAFRAGGVQPWTWWWKLLFTAVTLGSGFKGGEATPLFFIGAALGNTLAIVLGMPVDFCVALGFVSVFGGVTHTPLASAVMAAEIFGGESMLYYAISCYLAHLCSGRGIFPAQRATLAVSPVDSGLTPESPVTDRGAEPRAEAGE